MIKNFTSGGLEELFETGKSAKIGKQYQSKLIFLLDILNAVSQENPERDIQLIRPHLLEPKHKRRWAATVNKNWRLTFEFDDNGNAVKVDFEDYH